MTLAKGYLINTQMPELKFAPLQIAFHSSLHDSIDRLPAQPLLSGHRLDRVFVQLINDPRFKQHLKPEPGFAQGTLILFAPCSLQFTRGASATRIILN
jgi:hypothetical protein